MATSGIQSLSFCIVIRKSSWLKGADCLRESCSFHPSSRMSLYRSLDSDDASTSADKEEHVYTEEMLQELVEKAGSQDQEVQLIAVQQVL